MGCTQRHDTMPSDWSSDDEANQSFVPQSLLAIQGPSRTYSSRAPLPRSNSSTSGPRPSHAPSSSVSSTTRERERRAKEDAAAMSRTLGLDAPTPRAPPASRPTSSSGSSSAEADLSRLRATLADKDAEIASLRKQVAAGAKDKADLVRRVERAEAQGGAKGVIGAKELEDLEKAFASQEALLAGYQKDAERSMGSIETLKKQCVPPCLVLPAKSTSTESVNRQKHANVAVPREAVRPDVGNGSRFAPVARAEPVAAPAPPTRVVVPRSPLRTPAFLARLRLAVPHARLDPIPAERVADRGPVGAVARGDARAPRERAGAAARDGTKAHREGSRAGSGREAGEGRWRGGQAEGARRKGHRREGRCRRLTVRLGRRERYVR